MALAERVAAETSEQMRASFGDSPSIRVSGAPGRKHDTFTYVPRHMEFVLGELLRNACKSAGGHLRGILLS